MSKTKEDDGDYVKVWPRSGAIVSDEYTGQPIAPGSSVPNTRLTQRRIARGELSLTPQGETRSSDTHTERFDDGER